MDELTQKYLKYKKKYIMLKGGNKCNEEGYYCINKKTPLGKRGCRSSNTGTKSKICECLPSGDTFRCGIKKNRFKTTVTQIDNFTLTKLQNELKKRGLNYSGSIEQLKNRLDLFLKLQKKFNKNAITLEDSSSNSNNNSDNLLPSQQNKHEEIINKLQMDNNNLKAQNEQLLASKQESNNEETISKLQMENNKFKAQNQELLQTIANSTPEERIDLLRKEINSLEAENNALANNITLLKEEKNKIIELNKILENENTKLKEDNTISNNEISKQQEILEKFIKSKTQSYENIKELQDEVQSLNEKNEELIIKNDELQNELIKLQEEINSFQKSDKNIFREDDVQEDAPEDAPEDVQEELEQVEDVQEEVEDKEEDAQEDAPEDVQEEVEQVEDVQEDAQEEVKVDELEDKEEASAQKDVKEDDEQQLEEKATKKSVDDEYEEVGEKTKVDVWDPPIQEQSNYSANEYDLTRVDSNYELEELDEQSDKKSIEEFDEESEKQLNVSIIISRFLENYKKILGKPYLQVQDLENILNYLDPSQTKFNSILDNLNKMSKENQVEDDEIDIFINMFNTVIQSDDEILDNLEDNLNKFLEKTIKEKTDDKKSEEQSSDINAIISKFLDNYIKILNKSNFQAKDFVKLFDYIDPKWKKSNMNKLNQISPETILKDTTLSIFINMLVSAIELNKQMQENIEDYLNLFLEKEKLISVVDTNIQDQPTLESYNNDSDLNDISSSDSLSESEIDSLSTSESDKIFNVYKQHLKPNKTKCCKSKGMKPLLKNECREGETDTEDIKICIKSSSREEKLKILKKLGWNQVNEANLKDILKYEGHKDIIKAVQSLKYSDEDKIISKFLNNFNELLSKYTNIPKGFIDYVLREEIINFKRSNYLLIKVQAFFDYKKTVINVMNKEEFINEYEKFMINYLDEYNKTKAKYYKTKIYKDKIKPMLYEKILHNLKEFLYSF